VKSITLTIVFSISLFLTACNTEQPQQTATIDTLPADGPLIQADDYWAKDNLDLGRVGILLEESDDPREFETYLNTNDGINNLDLNGDGYADYISVEEFDDRDDNQRGLSLFTRFGPDLIQEIATIIFHRDDYNSPGARILLTGNEQLYGDNYYYETNWLDRSVGIVSALFTDRRDHYRSPYYYGNYPDDYVQYQIVETPIYRTRIEQRYPSVVFVQTASPAISSVKIKSKYKDKWMDNIHAKLVKPTKEQSEFKKNNPRRPDFAKSDKPGRSDLQVAEQVDDGGKKGRPDSEKPAKEAKPEKGKPAKEKGPDKAADNGKPEKQKNDQGGGQKGGKGKDKN
jgi:hypothetical protein